MSPWGPGYVLSKYMLNKKMKTLDSSPPEQQYQGKESTGSSTAKPTFLGHSDPLNGQLWAQIWLTEVLLSTSIFNPLQKYPQVSY